MNNGATSFEYGRRSGLVAACVWLALFPSINRAAEPAQKSDVENPGESLNEELEASIGDKTPSKSKPTTTAPAETSAAKRKQLWLTDLVSGERAALAGRGPILVRVGAEYCPWCRKLDLEFDKPEVQTELARWTLVELNAQHDVGDVRKLNVGPIPALRLLTADGRVVESHDGYLPADELIAWLKEHFDAAAARPDEVLLVDTEPSLTEAIRLVRQLGEKNAVAREAAVRRLAAYPAVARDPVVKAFREGNLATRLSALELLVAWKAPVAEFDPWRPDTLTAARFEGLDNWLSQDVSPTEQPLELSSTELAAARRDIDRLLKAPQAEAAAIRERIARLGKPLLPEVYERLKNATSDEQRAALLALRYRLAADGALVLRWPGGLERLAAADSGVRQKAANELAAMAQQQTQGLLLELFSDPDPLVREISLRGLRKLGGKDATAPLARLLDDPEPNVRAAVLKQLAEDAPTEMLAKVAAYVEQEKDPDLVVHAIRFLRQVKTAKSMDSLVGLLSHESWQVRAEAVVAIGELGKSSHGAASIHADAEQLMKLIDDPDAFVVSRALEALHNVSTPKAIKSLVQAAEKHPSLAPQIAGMLAASSSGSDQALSKLREFLKHSNAAVRAAAIKGLTQANAEHLEADMLAALADGESEVRIAAAHATLELLERTRSEAESRADSSSGGRFTTALSLPETVREESLLSKVFKTITGGLGGKAPAKVTPSPQATEPKESEPKDQDQPPAEPAEKKGTTEETPAPSDEAAEERPHEAVATSSYAPHATPGKSAGTSSSGEFWDQWLPEVYAGKHRPAWTKQLVEALEKMLAASDPEERMVAALALIPLGRQEVALPALIEVAESKPQHVSEAAGALVWLVWPERLALFERLLGVAGNEAGQGVLLQAMTRIPDRRAADVYWKFLDRPSVTGDMAWMLAQSLRQVYFGDRYWDASAITARERQQIAADAAPWAEVGTLWQRLVALDLLLAADADRARSVVEAILKDETADPTLRRDAFQILLLAESEAERKETSIAALAGDDIERRKVALKALVLGKHSLNHLVASGYRLQSSFETAIVIEDGTVEATSKGPRKLKVEHVRPLVGDADPEVAAFAGYLLVTLGEKDGIEPLVPYWREHHAQEPGLDKLMYGAITELNDPQYLSILEEIYARLEDYGVKDFYWTIRTMTGPEVLQFRKRIRQEKGAEVLR